MTFVGKILVIVIMAFALLFLGISTVVFTTHTNWKEETRKQREKVTELNKKGGELTAHVDVLTKDLEKAKSDHKLAIDAAEKRIAALDDENKRSLAETTAVRNELEAAQQNARTALSEADERLKETKLIRDQKSAVEKQANDYKLQQTELNDKIREQERQNATLEANKKDLLDKVAAFSTLLRRNGLSDDIRDIKGVVSPPDVRGEVARIDVANRKMELTIGSDDGLVVGQEFFLFREKPVPEYLGKVKIVSVDPDQAVATVVGNTVQGKKIHEGDIVSSKIRR